MPSARANKNGQVKIVCFDENAETLAGVASGDIYGTVVQQPFEFGKQAITRMEKYLQRRQDRAGRRQNRSSPRAKLKKTTLPIFKPA